jgi:hypothetical protein
MSNTLTNMIPTFVDRFDVVSRELGGFIPSVRRNANADRVAKNQTVYSWAAPAATLSNITAANVSPQASDQAFTTKAIVVDNFKMTDFYLTGEEELGIGTNTDFVVQDSIEQAIRAIVNQIETDIWTAAYVGASRAYGTAGTTPFDSTNKLAFTAQLKKILDDNGAPLSTRSLVMDTTAGAALRTLTQLTNANEAGDTMTLRTGELLNVHGFSLKESVAVTTATAGTGASYLLNGALSVGATTVTVDTGSGTILAGDVVTIGSHKYVVATALSGGVFTINAPGIRATAADNLAITVNATSTRNLAFSQNAILLTSRLPALPKNGDIATDRTLITDPRSGLVLEVSEYAQYRQRRIEIAAAWGVKVIKPEHLAILLG